MSSQPEHGIVTPEAVPLEFEPAGVGSRAVALFIDLFVLYGLTTALSYAAGIGGLALTAAGLPDWVPVVILLIIGFGVVWGYPIAMEVLWRGRTLGKAALGLRVVTVEGAPVRFRHAAVRAVMGVVDFGLLGIPAVVSTLATKRNQRLGDLVAGTLVLRERGAQGGARAVSFGVPRGAEWYAATIDPAGVRNEDYAAIRSFLLRAEQLDRGVRDDLARRIAGPLSARLGHVPPPGVPAELFLWCLAARYQQRGTGAPAHVAMAGLAPVASVVAPVAHPDPSEGSGFSPMG